MKTILIVIAGMTDIPDPVSKRDTPLVLSNIPTLDTLAQRGEVTVINTISSHREISHKNALLSLLGYDFQKESPSLQELMEFGLNNDFNLEKYPSLRPFIIPGFSGHGVCITPSAWVRGVAKCALLEPLDIYSPGNTKKNILTTMAELACRSIMSREFVFLYVDNPLKASLSGNFEEKVKSLEMIDRYLLNPIADFVWKSDLYIHLAVTTDLNTPWHRRRPAQMGVPVVLYFNNHDRDGDPDIYFSEVNAMLNQRPFHTPSDLIRYLSSYEVTELDDTNLPF